MPIDKDVANSPVIDRTPVRRMRRKLLVWFDRHRRDLPWRRRAGDAYAQWVAEIMLQQTRVETVIPYYERWMKRFPTFLDLARATEDDITKHWEGLGYYRRAMHLHRAARDVAASGQDMPTDAAGLRDLPGIGDYTSAAIASIAYQEPVAAVDGNVARVISRLFAVEEDVLSPAGKAKLQRIADALLAPRRPGDFNQAWMDFGSAVCMPRSPKCSLCPLAADCAAAKRGEVERFPVKAAKKAPRETPVAVCLFVKGTKLWLRKRATGGLWSGLWEFPNCELPNGMKAPAAVSGLAAELGLAAPVRPRRQAALTHQLTHLTMQYSIYVLPAVVANGETIARGRRDACGWFDDAGVEALGLSTAHRRILAASEAALGRIRDGRA